MCGKEIHPVCGGISVNKLRLQEPDAFLVFYCQECRSRDQRNLATTLENVASTQDKLEIAVSKVAHSLSNVELKLNAVMDHIDSMTAAITEKEDNAIQYLKNVNLKGQLASLRSSVSDLSEQIEPQSTIISDSQIKLLLKAALDEHRTNLLATMDDQRSNSSSNSIIFRQSELISSVRSVIPDISLSSSISDVVPGTLPSAQDLSTGSTICRPICHNPRMVRRSVWKFVYVGNLSHCTTAKSLRKYAMDKFGTFHVICNPLVKKSRLREKLAFMSFKVGFKEKVVNALNPVFWPDGAYVREFLVGF